MAFHIRHTQLIEITKIHSQLKKIVLCFVILHNSTCIQWGLHPFAVFIYVKNGTIWSLCTLLVWGPDEIQCTDARLTSGSDYILESVCQMLSWIERLLLCALSVNIVPLWALQAVNRQFRWWRTGRDFYLVAFYCTYLKSKAMEHIYIYIYVYTIIYLHGIFLILLYQQHDSTTAEQVFSLNKCENIQ